MSAPAENFYSDWRRSGLWDCAGDALRDGDSPPERLLQAVWQHQRLQRDALKTADGKIVRVLHPGFSNAEGGPDFRGAVLQIGDDAPHSGDVEIDLCASGWRAHGHDKNPNFKNVILHAVWDPGQPVVNAPVVLPLKNSLDAPLAELSLSLENESLRSLPENLRGKCCTALRELDEARLAELLRAAARVRFENKAAQFRARARNAGWEQALWEGMFRALGYKHNVWPMQNLAETKSRWARGASSAIAFQARLLGIGGLLPGELTGALKSSDNYLRRIWDVWWRERDEFSDLILPRAAWKFHGLRPANHPQRRLVLASHWLADKKFVSKIEQWCAASIGEGCHAGNAENFGTAARRPSQKPVDSLLKIFQPPPDDFWSWHWTFRSARLKKPQPLLGMARMTDLAVNVILPWLLARAAEGGNSSLRLGVERCYFGWPPAEDNSVMKLARQRLLGKCRRAGDQESGTATRRCSPIPTSAAAQQGLMQIVRDFCEHSNAICENCRLPNLVQAWEMDLG